MHTPKNEWDKVYALRTNKPDKKFQLFLKGSKHPAFLPNKPAKKSVEILVINGLQTFKHLAQIRPLRLVHQSPKPHAVVGHNFPGRNLRLSNHAQAYKTEALPNYSGD